MTTRHLSLSDALALGRLDAQDQARLVRDGELALEALPWLPQDSLDDPSQS